MTSNTDVNPGRAGDYRLLPQGYLAFSPKSLPPDPPVRIDDDVLQLVAKASQSLGRLDAVAHILPNPDLFVRMYVRKEAVLSSEIEGTQASLTDLLEYEATGARSRYRSGVREVSNYIRAMNDGLESLKTLPLSNRLLKQIHSELMKGTRGGGHATGEFRDIQNWIGPPGSDLASAIYVPPPPVEMVQAMNQLEHYLHQEHGYPDLIKVGLVHSQFETIHPFLDGNGRMGRLLIAFFLCKQGVLERPLLYLSAYLRQHQDEYYDRLQRVRNQGDWEGWLKFFLTAIWQVATEASNKVRDILTMCEQHRNQIQERVPGSVYGLELLDELFQHPYLTVTDAAANLSVSYPTANGLFRTFEAIGLVEEVTHQERGRIFGYIPYVRLLQV